MKSYQIGVVAVGLLMGSSNVIAQSMTQSSSKSVTEKVAEGTDNKGNKTYTLPNGSVVSETTFVDWKKTHVTEIININSKFHALSLEKAKELYSAWQKAVAKDKNCVTFQWGNPVHTYSCKDRTVVQVNSKDIKTSSERKVVTSTPPSPKPSPISSPKPSPSPSPKKSEPAVHVVQLTGTFSYKEGGKSGKCMGAKGPQKCGTNSYDVNSAATKREDIKAGGVVRIALRGGGSCNVTLSGNEADRLNKGGKVNVDCIGSGGNKFEIKNLFDQQGQDKH